MINRAKVTDVPVKTCLSILLVLAAAVFAGEKPADDVGNYEVTWIGNSLPKGAINDDERSHVQHWIWGIEVSSGGRVYAGGGNESGHAISVYEDGDLESDYIPKTESQDGGWNWGTSNKGAVSFDEDYIYSINDGGFVNKWTRQPPYEQVQVNGDIDTPANEIVVRHDKLYLVGYEGKDSEGEIQIRELDDDFTLINSFTVDGAYDIAVEDENSIWVSLGGKDDGPNEIRRYDADGNQLPGTVDGFGKLMGISIGHHEGRLIACDDGPDKQVLFYDISDPEKPDLERRFGEKGGIYNETRGVFDNDRQLFDVQDAGTDADGNIYTLFSQSSFIEKEPGGAMIRAYSPEGEKLWELSSTLWTGTASVLPSTDGEEIYGVEEVFKLDPDADNSKCDSDYRHGFCDPAWKLHAISYDPIENPDDFRVTNDFSNRGFRGSAEIRELDGKRVIFRQNMYSGTIDGEKGYDLLVFEDRPSMISHHKGQVHGNGHAWYPDLDGNVWEANAKDGKIRMHEFGGFDDDGAPIYSEYEEFERPDFFQTFVTRIYYDSENDVMYLSGYGESRQHDKWFDGEKNLPVNGAGTHLLRYDDWKAGNREPSYKIDLPWDGSNRSLPPKTWYKAGDYIFTAPVRPKDGKTIISVFNAHSGEFKGTMSHYDKFGQTGWIDITRGLTAFQRSNGEYIVILEDNAYAKNIVYRWTPPDVTYRKTGTVESDARVHKGQEKSDALAELPERVDVIGENGERGDAAVEWEIPKYEGKRPGRYKAVGRLTLPAGWKGDPDNANATVTVTTATEDDKTETLWSHDFEDETNMGIWSPTKWEEKDLPAPPSDGTFVGKASVSSDGGYSANNARITPEKRLPPGDVKKLVYSAQVYIPEYDQDALDWARITYNFMAGDEDGNRMNDDPNLDIANPDGMTMFEDVPVGEWHDIEFTIDITEWQDHPDAVHFRGLWNPLQISVDKDALGEGEDYEFTAYIDNVKVQYRPPAATEDPTDQEAERQR